MTSLKEIAKQQINMDAEDLHQLICVLLKDDAHGSIKLSKNIRERVQAMVPFIDRIRNNIHGV